MWSSFVVDMSDLVLVHQFDLDCPIKLYDFDSSALSYTFFYCC